MLPKQRSTHFVIALATALFIALTAQSASAGTYVANACLASSTGDMRFWTHTETAGSMGGLPYWYDNMNCAPGGFGLYRRFESNGAGSGSSNLWNFTAPIDTYITRVELDQYAVPRAAGSYVAVWSKLSDGTSNMVGSAWGGSGSSLVDTAYTFSALGAKTVGFSTGLGCRDDVPACSGMSGSDNGAEYLLKGARITLADPSSPTVNSISGPGWSTAPADGVHAIEYGFSDTGSGLKETAFLIDGILQASNSLPCDSGPRPCAFEDHGTFAFDTTKLSEGPHAITVRATDGANNTSEKHLSVTVRRPPRTSDTSPVSVTNPGWQGGGSPAVGDELAGTPGSWSGSGNSYSYQWMRCDSGGTDCAAIPGATGLTYSPTASDLGHALVFCVTASNSGGSTTSCSAPTPPVVAQHPTATGTGSAGAASPTASAGPASSDDRGQPNGTPPSDRATISAFVNNRTRSQKARYGKRVRLAGRLIGPDGKAIANAIIAIQVQTAMPGASMSETSRVVTGKDGKFSYVAPAGPSRTVRFAYRAYTHDTSFADTADVRLIVSAGVTMKAGPRVVHNRRTTVFTGRIGGPVPRKGVVVDLQVHFRKKWRTFAAPRTNRRGVYKFKYRFVAGAAQWKFRARVRTDSSYPYSLGVSRRPVTVKVVAR